MNSQNVKDLPAGCGTCSDLGHVAEKLPLECSSRINLMDLDLEQLTAFFLNLGERSFRAEQVFKWIHARGVEDFALMTDLSKSMRGLLPELCEIKAPEIAEEKRSNDGTVKWLMRLADQNFIETVFIPEADRGTLCISSQVGCTLNCTFCSTATQGFNRNLTVSEIIGQLWRARQRLNILSENGKPALITNVVMMGMGEPLLNFTAVKSALSIMRHENGYVLPRRRVTVSTSGVVPEIDRLSVEADVSLAVSLHAPNDDLRSKLVPLNKKYPIAVLLDACCRYVDGRTGRHVTIEYVMLRGVNDQVEHARQLARLLRVLNCKINLIPFNPYFGTIYERSNNEDIEAFKQVLAKAGYITTVRRTRGDDIDAACGQLVGRIVDRTRRHARFIATQGKNAFDPIPLVVAN
jgi:23S rRNA (adenine2503-C2)-methyltransferase